MSSNSSLFQSPFLITSRKFPTASESELQSVLTKSYTDISNNVNISTSGIYEKLQIVTRNKYFNDNNSQQQRQSYRQTYSLDALPNAGTATIPLNIDLLPQSEFVLIMGTANEREVRSVPIPFVNVAAPADGIQIEVDWVGPPPQIIITTTTGNWTAYSAIIVLEYILG